MKFCEEKKRNFDINEIFHLIFLVNSKLILFKLCHKKPKQSDCEEKNMFINKNTSKNTN